MSGVIHASQLALGALKDRLTCSVEDAMLLIPTQFSMGGTGCGAVMAEPGFNLRAALELNRGEKLSAWPTCPACLALIDLALAQADVVAGMRMVRR